jgi:MFS family permease
MDRLRTFITGTRSSPASPPPHFLAIRSSKLFILITICIAVFTDIFLYGIIVPVIPFALSSRASVPEDSVQHWVSILLAIYGAALLVGSPVAGWYADNSSSRRVPLMIGLLTLAGATIMLCLARSVALLCVGRALQGLSAAIVWVVGQALLVDTVGQKDIGQTMGYVSMSMSLAYLAAPLLGGVVYEKAGYYSVYYMAFGCILLDIFLRLTLVEKKVAALWSAEEVEAGTSLGHAAERSVEKTQEETHGEDSEPITDPTIRGNRYTRFPPIFSLLSSRRLLAALWGCLVQASLMTAFDSVVPLFVQRTFHWGSVGAGLTFLALVIPAFSAPLVGAVSDSRGPRWPAVVGFILAVPFWVLLRLVTHDSLKQKVLFFALLALIGTCLTIGMTPLMAEITYVVEAKEKKQPGIFGKTGAYAQAYGLFVMAFAAGTLIGPIWAGYVEDAAGWGTMSWTLGLFSATGAIPALIWTGGLITKQNAKSADERAIDGPKISETPIAESAV